MIFRLCASLVLFSILLVLPADGVKQPPTPRSRVDSQLAEPKPTQLNTDSHSVRLVGVMALTLVAVVYAFAARSTHATRKRPAHGEGYVGIESSYYGYELPLAASSPSYAPPDFGAAAHAHHLGRQVVRTQSDAMVTALQSAASIEAVQSLATAHQLAWRCAFEPQTGRNETGAITSADAGSGSEHSNILYREPWSIGFPSGFSLN